MGSTSMMEDCDAKAPDHLPTLATALDAYSKVGWCSAAMKKTGRHPGAQAPTKPAQAGRRLSAVSRSISATARGC